MKKLSRPSIRQEEAGQNENLNKEPLHSDILQDKERMHNEKESLHSDILQDLKRIKKMAKKGDNSIINRHTVSAT